MEQPADDFTARPYQIGLYEKAVECNSIIYLPTGAGKTYIAVMLIKKLSDAVHRPFSCGGKRTIFAVNTVALADQQCKYLTRRTHLSCGAYMGEMQVDYWTKAKWLQELESNQILVMTSQIFLDILNHGYISLSQINLMIFDECHRAVNDHPMRLIMQRFQDCPKEQQPRVLGLTATLINGNVKVNKLEETITDLETTFHAKIIAVESLLGVKGYATNPEESGVTFKPAVASKTTEKISAMLTEAKAIVALVNLELNKELDLLSDKIFRSKGKKHTFQHILSDLDEHLKLMGFYGGSIAALMHTIQLEYMKKSLNDQTAVVVVNYLITVLTEVRKILENEMEGLEGERIWKFSSGQVIQLFNVLFEFYISKLESQKFCALVFVKRRFTAKVLYHILRNLNKYDKRFKFLLAEFMVGYATNPTDNARESLCQRKWNKEVLHKFKNGQANCIIATDVIEEGVDVPDCTLVVRYDLPMDVRSYIQSKGRARHATSKYIILIPSDDVQFQGRYANYRLVEKKLEKFLVGKSHLRTEPTDETIAEDLYTAEIEPYSVTNINNEISVVTATSAISLVNRYCSTLGNSHFVSLTPTWKLSKINESIKAETQYQVSLQMPIISPLKNRILGDLMPSIKLAKRSAALNCCKELHRIGELSDNLLPLTVDLILEDVDYLFPNWQDEEKVAIAQPGTEAKKRLHEIIYPASLYSAFPRPDCDLYLHVLNARPNYSIPHDNRRLVFYNLLSDRAGYAILSTKRMPKLSSFPIYMNVGALHVDVEVNYSKLRLTSEEIMKLRFFHTMIFTEVLPMIKTFMVFDKDDLDNSFMIVPVDHKWEIDWDLVMRHQTIEPIKPEQPIHVTAADYELSLVRPSYRAGSVYIVTQICEDRYAESSFPTTDFYSYVHYFKDRHGLQVVEGSQPLLEVKPISSKINCIRPRGPNAGLSKRKRADLLEDFEEHLVPELCVRFDFPSLYWLKATILPSVIHRICQLLIAEQLRVIIQESTRLGAPKLSKEQKWREFRVVEAKVDNDPAEPSLELSLDDRVPEKAQPRPELEGPEFDILDSESKLYSWTKDEEPPDVERNIEDMQLIDIDYYYRFMSGSCENDSNILRNNQKASNHMRKADVDVPRVKLLCQETPNGPEQVDVMEALTSKMAHDVMNLEILETLGDSFLKFFTSLFLTETFPKFPEGHLTSIKGKMVGNRNLYYAGNAKKIPGMIKVDEFTPFSNFIVPGYSVQRKLQQILLRAEVSPNILYNLKISREEQLSGFLNADTFELIQENVCEWEGSDAQSGLEHFLCVQTVSDKTVADCVEALIGVYLKTTGLEGAAKILQWFEIIPSNISIDSILTELPRSPIIGTGSPNFHMPWATTLEERIGYKFKNRGFLLQAFSHSSYAPNDITPSYERLEFLGDAILDFLITAHIFENFDELTPGQVTDLRSALVNNVTFACLAVRYGLHVYLLSYSPLLNDMVDRFVAFQEQRQHAIDDELLYVLLEETSYSMAEFVSVPKVLGDIFESLAGAIYLDSGKSLTQVWQIFYAFMHEEIEKFGKNVPKQPVRVLYETQGAHPKFSDAVVLANSDTIMVPMEVTICGKKKVIHGFGGNTKEAKCAAAKQALKELRRRQ